MKDVGGIYNSLYFVGLLLYSQIQGSMFFASLISKLYQVDSNEKDKNLKEEYIDPHFELLSQPKGQDGKEVSEKDTPKSTTK